jgi:hypothetical protein
MSEQLNIEWDATLVQELTQPVQDVCQNAVTELKVMRWDKMPTEGRDFYLPIYGIERRVNG